MRVDDAIHLRNVESREIVNYVAMTPDGTKVYFTSPEQLTSEDTDTQHRPLHVE